MIDASKPMTVSLPAAHMSIVMQALYKLPYEVVAPLIDELRRQIQEAEPEAFQMAAASRLQDAAASAPRVNGIDVRE